MFALCVGVVLPLIRLAFRKPLPLILQFTASILVPLAVILPIIPHDVPRIVWKVPLVWDWDMVERKQLNIAYPWAASLMRRDDGMGIGYSAYVIDGKMAIMQGGGLSYVINPEDTIIIKTSSELEAIAKVDGGIYGEIPAGFTCDGRPIEEFFDTHNGTTSPFGMFGIQCSALVYQGIEIATINYGSLIDLDISDDGLLAVSVNMGSYDPTYVYVLNIREITVE
jgi:hypothetical protein